MQEHRTRLPLTDAERVLEELRAEAALTLGRRPDRGGERAPEPNVRVALASVAWVWGVFVLCYLLLPMLSLGIGAGSGVLRTSGPSALAFVAGSVVTALGVLIKRPQLTADPRRDPIISATLGGLAVWAVAENSFFVFRPFSAFQPVELGWFIAANVLEMALLGAMWASFTRRPLVAAGLGAAWQALIMGIVAVLLAV